MDVQRPALGWFLTELTRGMLTFSALPLAAPWLAAAPRGDGHGVLVLPGLLATDMSTALLRRFARWLGYDVYGWSLGRNMRSEEHTSELQSQSNLVCRLLLEKKKKRSQH